VKPSACLFALVCITAAACTPAPAETAPDAPAADAIAAPSAPAAPAADNTPDSLASLPPAGPAAPVGPSGPASSSGAAPPAVAAAGSQSETLAMGRAAYARTCAMCHGPAGLGTQLGVALTAGLDAAAVKEKIVKGKVSPTDMMPPMGAGLSEAELDALASFVEAGLPQ